MKTWLPILVIIIAALVLSSAPYLIGYSDQTPGFHFMGLTHNIDDACVYLSWMRQTADGAILIRNQFTVEPQEHLQFNLLFLILGSIAGLLNASLIAVYHAARIVFGVGLLLMIYHFGGLFLKNRAQRISLLLIIAFSSGIGWMFQEGAGRVVPVDMWQPEAITFLSLYLNPLFLCALILMLASLMFLLRMRETGRAQDAVIAGVFVLLLANIHTYDIVTIAIVWLVFLAADAAVNRRIDARLIGLSALAGAIASPALLYQLFLYHSEEVFRLRANTSALSPPLWAYLAGFGVIAALAAFGLRIAVKQKVALLLPVVWAVAGFAIPYLPLAQQRKLLMGIHIPLAILAVVALAWLVERRRWPLIPAALVVAVIAFPSNLLFMANDIGLLRQNQTATLCRPQLSTGEVSAMRWLRENTQTSDALLMPPDIACFTPALAGNRVYAGHWSETPDYYAKLREYRAFIDSQTDDANREQYILDSQVDYVWWNDDLEEVPSAIPGAPPSPAFNPEQALYLDEVFQAGNTKIYRVLSEQISED